MGGWRTVGAAALAFLASVGLAQAAPPSAVTASESAGRLTIEWELARNSLSSDVEIARSPKTASNGSFSDASKIAASVDESETSYRSAPLASGTWYVHVASYDPTSPKCTYDGDLKCPKEWSSVVSATVGTGSGGGGAGGGGGNAFALLKVSARQKATNLRVKAALAAGGVITVGGTVVVPGAAKAYKLKPVSASAAAGKAVTIKVKLPKKALKAAERALARHKKVRVGLTIRGGGKVAKRTVRLSI
jgi:hypothetical protein